MKETKIRYVYYIASVEYRESTSGYKKISPLFDSKEKALNYAKDFNLNLEADKSGAWYKYVIEEEYVI